MKELECCELCPRRCKVNRIKGEIGRCKAKINPKIAIPTHYGSIVGEKNDGEKFKNLLNNNIECKILIK